MLQRLAAFTDGENGGNPAGVFIGEAALSAEEMQRIAKDVGYSETVFTYRDGGFWRTRYFAPECEVPFCGHASIALGAALAKECGDGRYSLKLNDAVIEVEGWRDGDLFAARLQSPGTSHTLPGGAVDDALALFSYDRMLIENTIPPVIARAGATHLIIALNSSAALAAMDYDLQSGRNMMETYGLTTIMLVHEAAPDKYLARNAFAVGGVLEDAATGAAAAAFAGYLRDALGRNLSQIVISQGVEMGMPSKIRVDIPDRRGSGIFIAGSVRELG